MVGFIDNMTSVLFKEQEDGTMIYYPKGLLRQGCIIRDKEQKEKLYRFHKRINKYLLPLGVGYAMLIGLTGAPLIGMIPIVIVSILLYFRQKSLMKDLPIYEEKLTIKETKKSIADALPKVFLVFMIANGIMGVLLAVTLPILLEKSIEDLGGLMIVTFAMGVFLLGTGWYLYKAKTPST